MPTSLPLMIVNLLEAGLILSINFALSGGLCISGLNGPLVFLCPYSFVPTALTLSFVLNVSYCMSTLPEIGEVALKTCFQTQSSKCFMTVL